MSVESLLVQRCSVQRAEESVTAAGDVELEWSVVAENVSVLLEAVDVKDDPDRGGRGVSFALRAFFEADADLRPMAGASGYDRIVLNGEIFLVTGLSVSSGPRARLKVATLRRWEG